MENKCIWSEGELKSLFFCMMYMANIDGNVDSKEEKMILYYLENLEGDKPDNWKEFISSSNTIDPKDHMQTLKNMNDEKKKVTLVILGKLAEADGNWDDLELGFWHIIKEGLKIE